MQKSDMTEAEEEAALIENAALWNLRNPNDELPIEVWREKLAKAKAEGYKSERCECGIPFLAFHHFVACRRAECPMRGEKSLLDAFFGSDEKEAAK